MSDVEEREEEGEEVEEDEETSSDLDLDLDAEIERHLAVTITKALNPASTFYAGGSVNPDDDDDLSLASEGPVRKRLQRIGQFRVPRGYEIWRNGLFFVLDLDNLPEDGEPSIDEYVPGDRYSCLELVARKPIWLSRLGSDHDTGDRLVEIAYFEAINPDQCKKMWVAQDQISTAQKLVALSKDGLPVNDLSRNRLLPYFDAALHYNGPHLDNTIVAARSGHYETRDDATGQLLHGWLIGEQWVSPAIDAVTVNQRAMQELNLHLKIAGNQEDWIAKWQEWSEHSTWARWFLNSVMAAPFLRFLNVRTFVVHHWGASSSGKTSVALASLSAWGEPERLQRHFNSTQNALVEPFKYMSDLPLYVDELQAAGDHDMSNLVYSWCLQTGRGRANREGGLQQRTGQWVSVIRTTGEKPLVQGDLGGKFSRTIETNIIPFDVEMAAGVYPWLEQRHYGWGGQILLQSLAKLTNNPAQLSKLRQLYDDTRDYLRLKVPTLPRFRLQQLGAIATAQAFCDAIILKLPHQFATQRSRDDAVIVGTHLQATNHHKPVHEQAVENLRDHYLNSRRLWLNTNQHGQYEQLRNGTWNSLFGVIEQSRGEVWLVQREANNFFQRAGLNPRRIWHDFEQTNFLKREPGSKSYASSRVLGGVRTRVYVLNAKLLLDLFNVEAVEDDVSDGDTYDQHTEFTLDA